MIITRTPFRMSFFGGGTDIEEYFSEHEGAVLSTTFDKYCYVTARHLPPFFEHRNEIVYSKIERTINTNGIIHPMVREAMKFLDMHNMRITYDADLPARSGLGTSSSFAVGLLNAFYCLKGKFVDKRRLADEAIYLERVLCKEIGGIQDQIAASFGGFNKIMFNSTGYIVSPVVMSIERKRMLNNNLMLFYTGVSRFSSEIQKNTQKSIKEKLNNLHELFLLVGEAEKILTDKNASLNEFGKLLDYGWELKRSISDKISTNEIDEVYERAKNAGAIGGKLLGAGGGGFLLFYVEKENQERVKQILNKLVYVPFSFEDEGTKVMYFQPETFDIEED